MLDELVAKSLAEVGVFVFRLHENRDVPGHFVLYERFRDQSALDTHVTMDHFGKILQEFASLAEGGKPKITYYHALTE